MKASTFEQVPSLDRQPAGALVERCDDS